MWTAIICGIMSIIVSWLVADRRCYLWRKRAEEFNKLAHAAHASTERWQALAMTWKGTAESAMAATETAMATANEWREVAELRRKAGG